MVNIPRLPGLMTLGTPERDRVWESNLTGSRYRWDETTDQWETWTEVAGWHANPIRRQVTVRAQAGERFLEVTEDADGS